MSFLLSVQTFPESEVRDIACGGSHSAAIGNTGILYTWGHGLYGRLGHGNNLTQLKPKPVSIKCSINLLFRFPGIIEVFPQILTQ